MSDLREIQKQNQKLAEKIAADARQSSSLIGKKYVGIANGQVVVESDDLEEVMNRLDEVEPDSQRTFLVEPMEDLSQVYEIWEHH